jgi:signal transduction histidine kinase
MRFRRPKSLIVFFAAAVLLAVMAFEGADLWMRRDRLIAATENRASNLTIALSEYVRGSFASADAALRQLAVYGARIGGASGPSSEWQPLLHAVKAALPETGSLSVTDAQGTIRHSTLDGIVGQSRRTNYLFDYLSQKDPDEMVVDVPFPSPIKPGLVVLPVGRRLETPEGRFDGLVVAVVDPDAFRTFFRTVRIGQDGAIWVFHPSGSILFREPSTRNPLGESAADHPVLAATRTAGPQGLLSRSLEEGGPELITAYRTLTAPSLVVAVSLGRDEALADWQSHVRAAVVELLALSAVLGVLVLLLFRQIDARGRVEQELVDVQRLEADRLVTANQRLAEALDRERRAREDSESASRLKDEFLMTLSHELRTPMNAILGWVRMLASHTLPDEQHPRALTTIERNAQAQARLIEDLLDVSRAISGKLQLRPRIISAADALLAAAETLRPAMDAKRLIFDVTVDPDLPPVLADPDRLQQVVWNLLSNAIKFTAPGGRVELLLARSDNAVEITVRDTGIGISPAFMPFVFERFRQADAGPRREHGGLGIGLSIARHLVELHGGTITAESQGEGLGSTFRIHLPTAGSERFDDGH